MRGHRYQHITRYCDACAPFYRIGGIKGVMRLLVALGTVGLAVLFYFHP
jgi:hypothetical protein